MKFISGAVSIIALGVFSSMAIAGTMRPVVDPSDPNYEVIFISGDGTTVEQARHNNVADYLKFKVEGPQGEVYYLDNASVGQQALGHGNEEGGGAAQWSLFNW